MYIYLFHFGAALSLSLRYKNKTNIGFGTKRRKVHIKILTEFIGNWQIFQTCGGGGWLKRRWLWRKKGYASIEIGNVALLRISMRVQKINDALNVSLYKLAWDKTCLNDIITKFSSSQEYSIFDRKRQ